MLAPLPSGGSRERFWETAEEIARTLDDELRDAATLDRLEVVASAFTTAGDFARWAHLLCLRRAGPGSRRLARRQPRAPPHGRARSPKRDPLRALRARRLPAHPRRRRRRQWLVHHPRRRPRRRPLRAGAAGPGGLRGRDRGDEQRFLRRLPRRARRRRRRRAARAGRCTAADGDPGGDLPAPPSPRRRAAQPPPLAGARALALARRPARRRIQRAGGLRVRGRGAPAIVRLLDRSHRRGRGRRVRPPRRARSVRGRGGPLVPEDRAPA